MVGIQSAFEKEVELIREKVNDGRTERCGGIEYLAGAIGGVEAVVAAGGTGKVRAASCAQVLIDRFRASRVIFCGVAGGINPRLKVGDIVVSRDAIQYDHIGDIKTAILGRFSAQFNTTRVIADETLVALAEQACREVVGPEHCVAGTVLTGDRPVLTRRERMRLFRRYGSDCVEMEGAAVGMVCTMHGVPFLLIRAISDNAGLLAPLEFKRNLPESAKRAQEVVLRLLSLVHQ